MDDTKRARASRARRRLRVLAVAALALSGLGVAGASPTTASPPTAERWAAPSPRRWVSVAVATLWVSPGVTRRVDRLVTSPPASTRAWIAAMTLGQKQGLVGRIETQALYGTRVTVVSSSKGWSRVVVPSQPTPRDARGYPGWLPTWQLTSVAPASSASVAVVTAATTWVQAAPDRATSDRVMEVSYDTRLPVVTTGSGYVTVSLLGGRRGYVLARAVAVHRVATRWSASRARIIAAARSFIGLPYLWGGTAGFGYDCSGFVYSLHHAMGVTIPRDAAPQSARGVAVSRRQLEPGDLVFFRDRSGVVVHVAMYVGLVNGVASVIHSPNTRWPVSITPLSAWPASSYAGARRYLPDQG